LYLSSCEVDFGNDAAGESEAALSCLVHSSDHDLADASKSVQVTLCSHVPASAALAPSGNPAAACLDLVQPSTWPCLVQAQAPGDKSPEKPRRDLARQRLERPKAEVEMPTALKNKGIASRLGFPIKQESSSPRR